MDVVLVDTIRVQFSSGQVTLSCICVDYHHFFTGESVRLPWDCLIEVFSHRCVVIDNFDSVWQAPTLPGLQFDTILSVSAHASLLAGSNRFCSRAAVELFICENGVEASSLTPQDAALADATPTYFIDASQSCLGGSPVHDIHASAPSLPTSGSACHLSIHCSDPLLNASSGRTLTLPFFIVMYSIKINKCVYTSVKIWGGIGNDHA